MQDNSNNIVYAPNVIEFVTVVAETCLFLERMENYSRNEFIIQSVKLLPLLYQKAIVLETPEMIFEEFPERFVSEEDYLYVKEGVERLLGNDNIYLEVYHPQMKYSDTPLAAFISEDLADIYQELKDFALNYRMGVTDIMNDSLVVCLESFAEHWGQKLLNSLRALHALRFSEEFESYTEESESIPGDDSFDRNTFIDQLRGDM